MQANVPCEVNGVSTYVKHNSWVHAMGFVIFPCVLLICYLSCYIARLLWDLLPDTLAGSGGSGRDSDSEKYPPFAFLHLSDNGVFRFVRITELYPLPGSHERVGIFRLRVR